MQISAKYVYTISRKVRNLKYLVTFKKLRVAEGRMRRLHQVTFTIFGIGNSVPILF